jgi:hypothetical protein
MTKTINHKNYIQLTSPFVLLMLMLIFVQACAQKTPGPEKSFTSDGAWCWFQDPRAIYVKGQLERTYAQWVTHDGALMVGAYNHATKGIETFTLKENWDADDHNVGAFLLLADKRIMVFYARHNKQGIYCRTSSNPEDLASWEEEIMISTSDRITYAHPIYLSEEQTYYVFWRGPSWKPTFSTSKDGKTWSEPLILLQDIEKGASNVRPYTKITSDGKSSIHFTFTDGHPRVEPQNSVYYIKYEDGKFFKADGSEFGTMSSLPIRHTESDVVYDGKSSNVRAWVWDIALDTHGNPVIAYTRLPEETDHRYCYARWDGQKWMNVELTAGGKWFPQTLEGVVERETYYSGGISLNHSNTSVLYLSRPVKGIFEIEKWSSEDEGATWKSRLITTNSSQNNVRPVVPRGYSGKKNYVLWMYGDYEHYTKYNTGIKLLDSSN